MADDQSVAGEIPFGRLAKVDVRECDMLAESARIGSCQRGHFRTFVVAAAVVVLAMQCARDVVTQTPYVCVDRKHDDNDDARGTQPQK